jgi:hypothetical protein
MTGFKSKKAAALDKLDSMERKALKLALEALCVAVEPKKGKVYAREFEPIDCFAMHEQAITAIQQALATQKPPYGYVSIGDHPVFRKETPEIGRWETVYTTPPAQPTQEPRTMEREALKLALEALKIARDQIVDPEYGPIGWDVFRLDEVLSIGKQALAAPVQEPAQPEPYTVAWSNGYNAAKAESTEQAYESAYAAGYSNGINEGYGAGKAYAAAQPAQRTWVGLTDEEAKEVWKQLIYDFNYGKFAADDTERHVIVEFYRAIEAKLKEKNT